MSKILIIISCLLFATNGFAATYYIDYSTGADTNNGTLTSTPFKHCPGDANASDTAASTTLSAGDQVIFRGGVKYSTSASKGIEIEWAGSEGNPIVYDGDSGSYVSRWADGTNKAIIDGGGVTEFGLFTFYDTSKEYIIINSFVLQDGYEPAGEDNYCGLICTYKSANHVTVSNCDFADAGVVLEESVAGYGVKGLGDYWTIYNCTFTNCHARGINFDGSYNQAYNNTITGISSWPMVIGNGGSGLITDNKLYNNTIYDIEDPGPGHANWLWIFGGNEDDTGLNNTYIYNNLLYNSGNSPVESGAGFIHMSTGTGTGPWNGLYIYNNVMFNGAQPGTTGIMMSHRGEAEVANVYIYNNTIYQRVSSGSLLNIGYDTDPGTGKWTNVYIKNNAFVHECSAPSIISVPDYGVVGGMYGTVEIDYNYYYTEKTTNKRVFVENGGQSYVDFEDWQLLGYDANGIGPEDCDGGNCDPLFANVTPATFDLQLTTGSPLIDAGASLDAVYNTDILGESRPKGSGWDIGPYEKLTAQTSFSSGGGSVGFSAGGGGVSFSP